MSDTFRKQYRELTEQEKEIMEQVKTKAEELEKLIDFLKADKGKNPRHLALAMTKLEESVMWTVKAITE